MTLSELQDRISRMVSSGYGEREVVLMSVEDGQTCADEITDIFPSQPYDGELIWILTKE